VALLAEPAFSEAVPASHADLIRRVLARSIRSQTGINIRGRQTEWTPGAAEKIQISERQYVRSKEGRGLTVVTNSQGTRTAVIAEDDEWNRTYDPRARTLTISRTIRVPSDSASITARIHRILSSYRVMYKGASTMAGRPCHLLNLDPHDPFGRPIRVWIDANTGVTLARQESDRRGNSFGMTAFTSIAYPKSVTESETAFSVPKETRAIRVSRSPLFRTPGALKKWARMDVLLPISMPRGFEFETGELISLGGAPTFCLRYSDGLAVITLFQTQTARTTQQPYQSVAWKMLPRGESVAVSGQTHVSTVVIGPRDSEGIMTVARAIDRQRESDALEQLGMKYRLTFNQMTGLRDRGLSVDCLAALLEVSRRSRRPLSDLLALKRKGWTWKQIARHCRADSPQLASLIRPFECR
jgi:negative regulator of sigma E activity